MQLLVTIDEVVWAWRWVEFPISPLTCVSPLQHSRTTVRVCDQTCSDPNGLGLRFSSVLDLPTCAAWWALQAQADHLHFVLVHLHRICSWWKTNIPVLGTSTCGHSLISGSVFISAEMSPTQTFTNTISSHTLAMGFRQNFSGRRRHHVIAPSVLSLSRKHVDGWVLGLTLYQWFAVEMASKYSDWTIKQLKEELSKKCCKNSG